MQVNEAKYHEALTRLKGVLERARTDGDGARKDAERAEVYARYQPRFIRPGLDTLDAETFQSFLLPDNNHHWTNINRQSSTLVRDMLRLRKALATLLDDTHDLGRRLRDAFGLVKGLRMAVATAYMHVAEPEKYGVWNKIARNAVRSLAIWPDPATNDDVASYPAGNELLLRLSRDLGVDLWTLDWLWYAVSEANGLPGGPAGVDGLTPTYLFTWNPANWEWTQETIAGLVSKLGAGEAVARTWSTGRSTQPAIGDRFYLIRLGDGPRGIFASGKVTSRVEEGPHWDRDRAAAGDTYRYVKVRFDEMLNPWTDQFLLQSVLVEKCPDVDWSPQASGTRIPAEVLFPVEEAWQRHLLATTERKLPVVGSLAEIRENLAAFARTVSSERLEAREIAQLKQHFVWDPRSKQFAPHKWAGLRGMTPETYATLASWEQADYGRRGFRTTRAEQSLLALTAATFAPDAECESSVRAQLVKAYSADVFAKREPGALKFLRLPDRKVPQEGVVTTDSLASDRPPQNVIYYGPPGTGKTYRVIEEAVRLCDGTSPSTRGEVQARFRRLQTDGRIELVTFHQSYSYEEFVEGIRPVLLPHQGAGGGHAVLTYEVRSGVFKRLCRSARSVPAWTASATDLEIESARIWKMSLGDSTKSSEAYVFEDCLEKSRIALGFGGKTNFAGATTFETVLERLPKVEAESSDWPARCVHRFWNEIQVGDLVVISGGLTTIRAIGQVAGPAQVASDAVEEEEYAQVRPVRWIVRFEPPLPCERLVDRQFTQKTLYLLNDALRPGGLRALLSGFRQAVALPHVLVIDEINRGNVAKILGELITLLEPDKRLGAPNELVVRLPYSGEEFGVPGNLHVLGTMNTADRSIAFLDAALRRRFRFVEILPDAQVVKDLVGEKGVIEGVDVAQLLETLNRRIEALYDRDHTLGHSYFLNCRNLADIRDAFVDRVIPLLKEYFYDDWPKACSVLGCVYSTDSGPIKKPHEHPIILARDLSAEALPEGGQDLDEMRVQYTVNDAFLTARAPALRAFFEAVIRGK